MGSTFILETSRHIAPLQSLSCVWRAFSFWAATYWTLMQMLSNYGSALLFMLCKKKAIRNNHAIFEICGTVACAWQSETRHTGCRFSICFSLVCMPPWMKCVNVIAAPSTVSHTHSFFSVPLPFLPWADLCTYLILQPVYILFRHFFRRQQFIKYITRFPGYPILESVHGILSGRQKYTSIENLFNNLKMSAKAKLFSQAIKKHQTIKDLFPPFFIVKLDYF